MSGYIGLELSLKETAISDGKRIWRGKRPCDPSLVAEVVRKRAPAAKLFETGPLSVWFYQCLARGRASGDLHRCSPREGRARHGAEQNGRQRCRWSGASGRGRLLQRGGVKGYDSMLIRTLVAARTGLVRITTELSNQIRGLMKSFGLVVPRSKGGTFEAEVQRLLTGQEALARIILPLLQGWRSVRAPAAELGRQLIASARQSEACQLLMSIPGVGAVTATSFTTAIEDPENFRKSRSVGAWLGLTTRRYQSGEVDYDGHISRRGDAHLRGPLYEAATVILTRALMPKATCAPGD